MSLSSWRLSASWSRYFGLASAEQARAARSSSQRPAPQATRKPSREGCASDQRERRRLFPACRGPAEASGPSRREALEVGWLLCCLPGTVQAALAPELLALKRSRPFRGALPVDDYTWPDVSGVWRPPYPRAVLKRKTLEGLCSRLHDEVRLGVTALCASENDLPRPMRNALLVMQGRRLGQLAEMLARWLEPEEVALLFRQEWAAQR